MGPVFCEAMCGMNLPQRLNSPLFLDQMGHPTATVVVAAQNGGLLKNHLSSYRWT